MKYEQGGFVLEVTVELVTPEQTVPFAITVRSKDSSGAGTDKWFVDMTKLRQLGPEVETERGRVLRGLRGLSHEFAVQWLMKLRGRDLPGALKDTIAPSEFVQGGKAIQKTISQEALRKKIDQIFDPAAKDEAAAFDATLGCCLRDARRPSQIPPPPAYWSLNHKKHLEVAHDLSLLFDGDPAKGTRVICMGRVVVERTEGEPFALDPKRLPVWRVARFEITASHTMGPGEGSRERPRR
jgi:hypothetical protein